MSARRIPGVSAARLTNFLSLLRTLALPFQCETKPQIGNPLWCIVACGARVVPSVLY